MIRSGTIGQTRAHDSAGLENNQAQEVVPLLLRAWAPMMSAVRESSVVLAPPKNVSRKGAIILVPVGALVGGAVASIGVRVVAGLRRRMRKQRQSRSTQCEPGETSSAPDSSAPIPEQLMTPDQNVEEDPVAVPRSPELDVEMSPESLIVIDQVVQTLKDQSPESPPAMPVSKSSSSSSLMASPTTPEATDNVSSKSCQEMGFCSPSSPMDVLGVAEYYDELRARRELVSAMLAMARHNMLRRPCKT